jgi:hypothetical protein
MNYFKREENCCYLYLEWVLITPFYTNSQIHRPCSWYPFNILHILLGCYGIYICILCCCLWPFIFVYMLKLQIIRASKYFLRRRYYIWHIYRGPYSFRQPSREANLSKIMNYNKIKKWREDTNLHTVHKTTHQLLRTSATTPSAEHHMQ